MKVEIIRGCFYKTIGGIPKGAAIGEIIEVTPETGSELIAALKGIPGDYPAVIEVECLQNFDTADPNHGAISGRRGDKLKLPRELAVRLVYCRKVRPTDSSLWHPTLQAPPPPARDFTNEAEVTN
jgi:hypothetical protein